MGRHRKTYILAGTALVIATGFQLVFPWLLRLAIDTVDLQREWTGDILVFCLLLILVSVGEAIFTYLKGRWSSAAAEGTVRDLRNRIFKHLMTMPIDAHSNLKTGDVIQRSTSDVQTLQRFLGSHVAEVARTLCLLFGVAGVMLYLDAELALYALVLIPPIFFFSMLFFGKIQRRFEKFDESEGALSARIQEHLTGIRVVKAFAREDHERSLFDRSNREMVTQDIKLVGLHAVFWPTSDMLCMLQVVVVLLAGGLKTINGEISLGTFVAFTTYVMLLIWPVRHVGRLLGEMGRASVSLKRIHEILDLPVETLSEEQEEDVTPFRGRVVYTDVGFSYDDTDVLKGVTFQVEPGQTVAVLGATGSGKTTLVQLLTRFHEAFTGKITIDGVDIREMSRKSLRSRVGYVMQESFLFSRTIFDNIAFGEDEVTENRVHKAAASASMDRFVNDLEDGYDTLVGERGVTLSGGQKQRVALARILLKKPSILILDDTTSALDTETEARISEGLKNRMTRRTSFIITHRLSTAAEADLILVLDNGQLVEQGTHTELLAQSGHYRQLHQHQWNKQAQLSQEINHATGKTYRKGVPQTV